MTYWSEIIEIIEGGLDRDEKKVRAYSELLLEKLEKNNLPGDKLMISMIKKRLNGTYKKEPRVIALKVK